MIRHRDLAPLSSSVFPTRPIIFNDNDREEIIKISRNIGMKLSPFIAKPQIWWKWRESFKIFTYHGAISVERTVSVESRGKFRFWDGFPVTRDLSALKLREEVSLGQFLLALIHVFLSLLSRKRKDVSTNRVSSIFWRKVSLSRKWYGFYP